MCFISEAPRGFYEHSTPKARKEHFCDECSETIPIGAVYNKHSGKWDSIATYRVCGRCEEARDIVESFEESIGCRASESAPPFGHLLEALSEHRLTLSTIFDEGAREIYFAHA